jgi:hypothetical protein
MRSALDSTFSIVCNGWTKTFTKTTTAAAAERDAYFEEELNAREVEQEGHMVNEFYVRILSYPRCE